MAGSDHTLLVSYRPTVRALVAHVLGVGIGDPDVEDCTSEALRRALEGHARLQAGAPLRPWLLGIARHVALDARRARARQWRREVGADADTPPRVEDVETPLPDPHAHAESSQRAQRLQRALAALPAPHRQALSLHAEGLGYREVAAELGVPLGTVCTWIARSRSALAKTLRDAEQPETADAQRQ
jgi:RNA polymerase sigma-70 factor (ECF subfamily)